LPEKIQHQLEQSKEVPTRPRLPGHQLLRKLGEGTYGAVWLFEEDHTSRRVAVKFFPRDRR
jgi:hypothetical protein